MGSRVNTTVMIFLAGNFEFDMDRGGQFVVRGQELPTAYVRAKFEDRSFFRLQNIQGVPKFRNWVTYPRRRPLKGQFVVHGQELPTAYVHAKFEDSSFTRLRNIEGVSKFRNWGTCPRRRPISGQFVVREHHHHHHHDL